MAAERLGELKHFLSRGFIAHRVELGVVMNLEVSHKPPRLSKLRVNVMDLEMRCQVVDYWPSSQAGRILV